MNTAQDLLHDFFSRVDLTQYMAAFSVPGAFSPFDGWINIALGLLLCFFGARLFSISVIWFSGLLAGLGSYMWLAARLESLPALVIALIAGVLCALVLRSLLRVSFFMLGVVLGGSVAGTFMGDSIWVIAVMLASGVVSMLMHRLFIALICALCGAVLLANGLLPWMKPWVLSNPYIFPGLIVLFFIAGLAFQSGCMKPKKIRKEEDEE
jgi:hypothetical protein